MSATAAPIAPTDASLERIATLKQWYEKTGPDGHVDGVEHQVRFVPAAADVKLEVLDWGGSGPPVVFLAGLMLTAHSFDDFAPALTNRFHVYGITRRGFGASSQPPNGYDIGTRVEDLRQALNVLRLDRASLVGFSQAGEELTGFAGAYPTCVARLVYLDSCYDISILSSWVLSHGFIPGSSIPAFATRIWEGSARAGAPDITKVMAPALGICAIPETAADIHPDVWRDADAATRAWYQEAFRAWQAMLATREDFAKAPHRKIVEVPRASHMLFISDRGAVLRFTRDFLEQR